MIRENKILSGQLLEADFYPVFADGRRMPARADKAKRSTDEQIKYNRSKSIKHIVRMVNTNYKSHEDYFAHFTFDAKNAPETVKDARRLFKNYIERIKRRRAREAKALHKRLAKLFDMLTRDPENSLLLDAIKDVKGKLRKLESEFKCLYFIEENVYKRGERAGMHTFHIHAFMSGGIASAVLEDMWGLGTVNCRNYQPEKFGVEAAAKYVSKELSADKRPGYIGHHDKPKKLKPKDGKISPVGVKNLAEKRCDDREYWEKRYPGYRFIKCYARHNQYNGYHYVSVIMWRGSEEPPPWTISEDEWVNV